MPIPTNDHLRQLDEITAAQGLTVAIICKMLLRKFPELATELKAEIELLQNASIPIDRPAGMRPDHGAFEKIKDKSVAIIQHWLAAPKAPFHGKPTKKGH